MASAAAVATPCRVQINSDVAVPHAGSASSCEDPSEPCWRSAPLRRLRAGAPPDSPFARAFGPWAREAEAIATESVRSAFERVRPHLGCVAAGRGASMAIALAGADVCDHEATMRLAAGLAVSSAPGARVALVGPTDFRSLLAVSRCISEQLVGGGQGSCAADGAELDEDDEDVPQPSGPHVPRAVTPKQCARWLAESGSAKQVVILVEQADAAPKELLRSVLGTWASACGDSGIPISYVLGLQHPPQGRSGLLDGETLVPLISTCAVPLFDAQEACNKLLSAVAEDGLSPVSLCPELLLWLRDQFTNSRRSFSRLAKALALLCNEHISQNALAELCARAPASSSAASAGSSSSFDWRCLLDEQLQKSPELKQLATELMSAERPDVKQAEADLQADDEALSELAAALEEASQWRSRLCGSLGVWDVLLCTMQKTAVHEARVRRLWRLLHEVWPKQGDGTAAQESAISKMDRYFHALGKDRSTLGEGEDGLQGLLDRLLAAGSRLDGSLRGELTRLATSGLSEAEQYAGFLEWFQHLRRQCWSPLSGGLASRVLIKGLSCPESAAGQVERQLSSKASEAVLLPWAHGAPQELGDSSLLFRLLESCPGKNIELADLFASFEEFVKPNQDEADCQTDWKQRFGQALMDLHLLGMHVPQASNAYKTSKAKRPFAGWRLRKRIFGRVWVKPEKKQLSLGRVWDKSKTDEEIRAAVAAPAVEAERQERVETPEPMKATKKGEESAAPWVRAGALIRSVAQKLAPVTRSQQDRTRKLGAEDPAPAERGAKRQRVKMFMS